MNPTPIATHEPRSRPSFRERVAALQGAGTSWREPVEGRSSAMKPIPGANMTAGNLSMARSDGDDIGPDVAYDILTGRPGHATKVCRWLGRQLAREARHRSGNVSEARRCIPHLGLIAVLAYRYEVLGEAFPPAPDGVSGGDWGTMLIFAALLLEHAAEDSLALAERRARRAG